MKKYLLILTAIACLLCSCNKRDYWIDGDSVNPLTPQVSHISAEGGEIEATSFGPMSKCVFSIRYIAVFEHEKDENGNYVRLEDIEYRKTTNVLEIGESADLGYVTMIFTSPTTVKFTVMPCDETKLLNIPITVVNADENGEWFSPSGITIIQNE